jgi:hypothetical protein
VTSRSGRTARQVSVMDQATPEAGKSLAAIADELSRDRVPTAHGGAKWYQVDSAGGAGLRVGLSGRLLQRELVVRHSSHLTRCRPACRTRSEWRLRLVRTF